ncbi:MAG: acetate kinase [Desulfobacter sp.]|nr:acetate kinase [Desulfobacter sp.]WDP84883.1 MAG: acetate kinase [Desulfobacter sp.]
MNILIINTGSSSLKYQLFDMNNTRAVTGGVVERIGESKGKLTHKQYENGQVQKQEISRAIPDHKAAMHLMAELITQKIDAIGHRVVQGGETFKCATLITQDVKNAIEANNPLAPLHNPPNLTGICVAEALFPGKPQVAVFDTNFHQTIPEKAYLYALPYEYYTEHRVRKYGFHGTSHKYVAKEAARLMGKAADEVNLITLHLGNGCSICAVEKGECKDTSMGMTPLAGVMMGTRCGDLDPAIFGFLMTHTGLSQKEMDDVLNKKSGLKGICGYNDLRDIHDQAGKGNLQAALALDMFALQIKKYIGAYAAVLGRVDGLVFTAGVGENDEIVRAKALDGLSFLGIDIDERKNVQRNPQAHAIHGPKSQVQVWVVPTDEEQQIAIETQEVLKA